MAKEILIADSDKADQEEFQKIFETTDYHLIFSESGEDVLLRVKLFKPDLIIAGMSLGDQNGLELCETIKGDSESRHIPFILLSNIFEEVSEKDRERVRADGVISKPLHENEILNLVDLLMEEESIGIREEGRVEKEREWKSIAEIGKIDLDLSGNLSLDEPGIAEEEEIIELVDVVEEPESRVSIDDFTIQQKEEPSYGEINPLESWENLEEEKKPLGEGLILAYEEKDVEKESMPLQVETTMKPQEVSPEDELFEKIELEEILQKVEQLAPSLEKEWPLEKEERVSEEKPAAIEEPGEPLHGFEEFEAAIKKGVKAESMEQDLQPFLIEEPEKEVQEEAGPIEVPAEEEKLDELPEEEFPEELLEELLGEGEISAIEEPKEIEQEKIKVEEIGPEEISIEEIKPEEVKAEEIKPEEAIREELKLEEIGFEGIGFEEEAEIVSQAELRPEEEVRPKEVIPEKISIERLEEVEAPRFFEEPEPRVTLVDKQLEEVIVKGVQEMIGDFITKILPEMTQTILGLTVDRIEKMVKEIVPEMAEKAIQKEIKRLQKEEKE